jgi:hypothetical protein
MSIMKSFREMVADAIAGLAIAIETNKERPGIERVESAVAISRIFQGNAERQAFDHETGSSGYFRYTRPENNSRELGRV